MTAALLSQFELRNSLDAPTFEVRLGQARPAHSVYVRRRVLLVLVVIGVVIGAGVSARTVLADRGGVPASTPAVRSATVSAAATPPAGASGAVTPAASPPAGVTYIVQPGDTLWSLAERFHATKGLSSYLDDLVDANGGAALQPGQLITLP